jgi:hypothetical protein
MRDVILDPSSVAQIPLGANAWDDADFFDEDEVDDEPDAAVDPARRAGIMKAAEYLYDLDKKNGGIHGFALKPDSAPTTKPDAKKKKAPARELTPADVREQLRKTIVNAAPSLLAANPTLLSRSLKE